MPVICSRSTRLMPSMRTCMSRNFGTIRAMTSPIATISTGTQTAISQERPTSSCKAMATPPTHMIGAATSIVQDTSTSICTCCTSFVLRVISDGRAEAAQLVRGELADAVEEGRADVAAEAHPGARPEVDRRDRAHDLEQRDGEHPAAGFHDVPGVAAGDAVVDDVGVEAGQVQRRHRAHELQGHHGGERAPVRAQVPSEQAN
jgi:hypothetical protein